MTVIEREPLGRHNYRGVIITVDPDDRQVVCPILRAFRARFNRTSSHWAMPEIRAAALISALKSRGVAVEVVQR